MLSCLQIYARQRRLRSSTRTGVFFTVDGVPGVAVFGRPRREELVTGREMDSLGDADSPSSSLDWVDSAILDTFHESLRGEHSIGSGGRISPVRPCKFVILPHATTELILLASQVDLVNGRCPDQPRSAPVTFTLTGNQSGYAILPPRERAGCLRGGCRIQPGAHVSRAMERMVHYPLNRRTNIEFRTSLFDYSRSVGICHRRRPRRTRSP
jgi:hypothetical protein